MDARDAEALMEELQHLTLINLVYVYASLSQDVIITFEEEEAIKTNVNQPKGLTS